MTLRPIYTRAEKCAMAALILGIVALWVLADLSGGIGRQF